MSTTNAQFVFEDQYPFLDLTRGQGREFENDITQRCFKAHQKAFDSDQNNRLYLMQKLEEANMKGDAVLKIALNVRRALVAKLEGDILELRAKVKALSVPASKEANFVELQKEVDSPHPRLSVCLRLGRSHAGYGWAPHPAPQWGTHQRVAYLEGYAAVKEQDDWFGMVDPSDDPNYALFCNQLQPPIDKP